MASNRSRGRKSFRDVLRENNAADRFYAAMAGKEPMFQSEIKERKPRAALLTPKPEVPLEKDVQADILATLKAHPLVAFVGRFNRGTAISEYNGKKSYTRFNTVDGFPDLHGMLKGGAAFYIEVKRKLPDGRKPIQPSDDQREFIDMVKRNYGRAGVAYSVEDALAIISGTNSGDI